MILALLIGIALFVLGLSVHLGMLGLAKRVSPPGCAPRGPRLIGGSLLVLLSHLAVAALFAVGFALAASIGLGGFDKEPAMSWMDYYYFSLITVTTVGLGDVYPTQHLRVITGIASLTGFLLISCTAQYVYQTMSKQEE
ncbi:two pore domain potassium channel family protein [Porphyrobacter algicida]|uniref:Two pore domain potassium channel family protein n=1 Tax=Qipengyuania algicida TaxID=1836209 RepID=A0A845ALT3_9SPHN|nr:potassium channel family protein [Qipengyuania algicida]MXP29835.1 two pore domain potassium channel family protein [Qipengyuania algicida]